MDDGATTFLFRSCGEALWWCVYTAPKLGIIKPPSFSRFISKDRRKQIDEKEPAPRAPRSIELDRMPFGQDATSQAGLILSALEDLEDEEIGHLFASTLKGRERARGRTVVRRYVIERLEISKEQRSLARTLIANHYVKRFTSDEIAKKHRVTQYHRRLLERRIGHELQVLAFRSETHSYDRLQQGGVVT